VEEPNAPDGLNRLMADQFDKPVLIRIGGGVQSISSATEALDSLSCWPVQGSRKRQNAFTICTLVTDGLMNAEAARRAFELAADEASILLPDDS
jgi:hypothetical protein